MQPLLDSEHSLNQFDLQGLMRLCSLTGVTVGSQCIRILFLHTPPQPLTPSHHGSQWDGQGPSLAALGMPHSLWPGLFRVVVHNAVLLPEKSGPEKTCRYLVQSN